MIGLVATLYEFQREWRIRFDEGNEPFDLTGNRLEGGEIVSEVELAGLYREAILSQRSIEPDPTIIRSTLYNAMRYFGTDHDRAIRRSNNVSFVEGQDSKCNAACVYDTRNGLGAEFTSDIFSPETPDWAWPNLLRALTHEAYHLSVETESDYPALFPNKEKYGVLGEYTITGGKRGFRRLETHSNSVNLLHFTGKYDTYSFLEEFFAEVGAVSYGERMREAGLKGIEQYGTLWGYGFLGYPALGQGIVDMFDTKGVDGHESWQKWWGDAIDLGRVNRLHYDSDRFKFLSRIGERVMEKNARPDNDVLSPQDVAALGIVAFVDFVMFEFTEHQVLTTLISNQLNKDVIMENALTLYDALQQTQVNLSTEARLRMTPHATTPTLFHV